jgi:hypothetical protein
MSRLASGAAIHPHQALEAAGLSGYRDGRENAALDEKRDDHWTRSGTTLFIDAQSGEPSPDRVDMDECRTGFRSGGSGEKGAQG